MLSRVFTTDGWYYLSSCNLAYVEEAFLKCLVLVSVVFVYRDSKLINTISLIVIGAPVGANCGKCFKVQS